MEPLDPQDPVPPEGMEPGIDPPRNQARRIDCGRDPVPHPPQAVTSDPEAPRPERPDPAEETG